MAQHVERLEGGPRIAWFLHGILGSGRNWRGFAAKWMARHPGFSVVLPDLRHHGATVLEPAPDTVAQVAADLQALPTPDVVVGHSFGGKVALVWGRDHATAPVDIWSLDSPPAAGRVAAVDPTSDPVRVLAVLRTTPADRAAARLHLLGAGFAPAIVDWLLTSLVRHGDGWRWVWPLAGIEALLDDFFKVDLMPYVTASKARPVHLVVAGRGGRWPDRVLDALAAAPASSHVVHVLPNAGHWVHVDDPNGLLHLMDG